MEDDSETVPLLIDPYTDSPGANEQTDVILSRNSTTRPFHRMTVALTWLSIAVSVPTFAFLLTVLIMDQIFWRDSQLDPTAKESSSWMMTLAVAMAFIGSLNLICLYMHQRAMPLFLNLVIDVIVIFYSFACSVTGLVANASWCKWSCGDTGETIQILVGIGLSFGLVIGITHLALFLMRCSLALRWVFERRRNGSRPFRIPTGHFTVEFTIRFLRQDNADVFQPGNGE